MPHVYFRWTEGDPLMNLFRFLVTGEGEIAPVTREVLREADGVEDADGMDRADPAGPEEVADRAVAAGLTPFSHGDYDPGRRFYVLDPDGIEYEIVSYDG